MPVAGGLCCFPAAGPASGERRTRGVVVDGVSEFSEWLSAYGCPGDSGQPGATVWLGCFSCRERPGMAGHDGSGLPPVVCADSDGVEVAETPQLKQHHASHLESPLYSFYDPQPTLRGHRTEQREGEELLSAPPLTGPICLNSR